MSELILLGVCALELIIIILIVKFKTFNNLIEQIVVRAENELKGKDGKEKLAYALEKIRGISFFSKFFSDKRLIEIINKLVSEFNKFISK